MVRFARCPCLVVLVVVLGYAGQTAAQDAVPGTTGIISAAVEAQASAPLPRPQPTVLSAGTSADARPAALIPLYASFVALQVLDMHSTMYALDRGAVEANPAVKGFVDNRYAMGALKAAGTAGVIFVSEKVRKRNKAAAIGLMVATNAAMTWVVQHNYRAVP